MLFETIVETYMRLESTTKRLEMTDILADLFKKTTPDELEIVIYLTQGKIHPDWKGHPEIGMAEKMVIETISMASGYSRRDIESILSEKGDIGLAAESAVETKIIRRLSKRNLTVQNVYETLNKISKESGKGSSSRKKDLLVGLIVNSSPKGARFLTRMVIGTLRLGVGDMTILDALAVAFTRSSNNRNILERAYNLTSDLGYVAWVLAEKGLSELSEVKIKIGNPIRMMQAQRLSTPEEIIEKLGESSLEYKLDGERFQIHKKGTEVQIFSRRLENITRMYPEVVEYVNKQVNANDAILEGEAVAIDGDTGEIKPFQTLMQRRRKHRIKEMMNKFPIAVFLFDCLFNEGEDLTLESYRIRRSHLRKIIKPTERFSIVKSIVTSSVKELEQFFNEAISEGTEGLVVKSLSDDSIYRAGARSWLWVKLKRSYRSKMIEPVDLVVVGGYHGRGRRAGSYGALLVTAFDPEKSEFTTVCKVGSGFTDQNLEEIPKMLEKFRRENKHPRVQSLLDADVWFTPNVVIEVLGDELTLSPVHTCAFNRFREDSGLAIRFPRFMRWRNDKGPEDATNVSEIAEMYGAQLKKT
jgi:DNA ligase-1